MIDPTYKMEQDRRAERCRRLKEIDTELANRNMTCRGRRMDGKTYWQYRHELIEEKARIEQEISTIKRWLHEHNHLASVGENRPKPGLLDEFDLKNAVMEPQMLLQHAYNTLRRLTSRVGTTDADRALLDSIANYLQRHGILI